MTLTNAEQRFLAAQPRGYFSTIGPDGVPQVNPLGFFYNAVLGTIDICGFNMSRSAKYRNVKSNPRVAFVVDEVTEPTMDGAHFLEIRGVAETATGAPSPDSVTAPDIIRVHPRRIIAYNVDPQNPGLHTRDLAPEADRPDVA